ncbi:hypothetical protein [Escherichia coli]|uniref:hypothetical protein n=1 Tax=Escherichia coli TaxID=562 RepID=UPI00106753D8|nr:hypothetical protein [Escherichia coli]
MGEFSDKYARVADVSGLDWRPFPASTREISHNYPANSPDFTRKRLKQLSHILDIPYTPPKA